MNSINDVWDFIAENPRIIGMPLSEQKGIDLLAALRDVHKTIDIDPKSAQVLLTLLANVLVASAQGDGDLIIEEVIVQEAMQNLDNSLKGFLSEGH